jgi:hypothetical protein
MEVLKTMDAISKTENLRKDLLEEKKKAKYFEIGAIRD